MEGYVHALTTTSTSSGVRKFQHAFHHIFVSAPLPLIPRSMLGAISTPPAFLHDRHFSLNLVVCGRRRFRSWQNSKRPAGQQHQALNGEHQAQSTANSDAHEHSSKSVAASRSKVAEQVAHPATFFSGLAGFAILATGIQPLADQAQAADCVLPCTSTGSLQPATPLLALDQAVHLFVVEHTTPAFRQFWGEIIVSDTCIAASIVGWCLLSMLCLLRAPQRTAAPLGLAWAFYFLTAGAFGSGDPPLVDWLKHSFARIRPSEYHHTFSFPSGHTSAAVFTAGALLTVLLPLALQLLTEANPSGSSNSSSGSPAAGGGDEAAAVAPVGSQWDRPAVIYGLWAVAGVTTATGRVLADAHWVSDTLAAGCLSVALVSGLGMCTRALIK